MQTAAPPIWTPAPEFAATSRMADYQRWLARQRGLHFDSYDALWRWSVGEVADFWQSIWDYFDLHSDAPIASVLADAVMPGARWFPEAANRVLVAVTERTRREDVDAYAAALEEVLR